MKTLDLAMLFVLCFLLAAGIYFFWSNFNSGTLYTKQYSQFIGNISEEVLFESSQFYPRMRFPKKEISYYIEPECGWKKIQEVERAFEIIKEETVLSFYHAQPNAENAEISVICSEISPEEELTDSRFFIAGEGGPTEARNLTNGYLIIKGKVSLFKDEKCDNPKLALHELLHVLGFDHNNNPKSVMYPITRCDQEFDSYIAEEINLLYSEESLPNLAILQINASRSFQGVSFKISIINIGYIEAKDSQIEVFAGINKVANYTLGDMQPGMISTLEVQNLRIKKSEDSIKFFASYRDGGEELSYQDNSAEIFLLQEDE